MFLQVRLKFKHGYKIDKELGQFVRVEVNKSLEGQKLKNWTITDCRSKMYHGLRREQKKVDLYL